MKNTKRILAAILASAMLFSFAFMISATEETAKILNIYSDGMLFLQNSEAVIEGKGNPGSKITLSLYDKNNTVIATGNSTTASDGTFAVTFPAPAGSFSEYTITLSENGKSFETLSNVVFGELWLASGQSNMQYPLIQTKTGAEKFNNSEKFSKWLRVLMVPAYPEYKNSTSLIPAEPQNDLSDAVWVNGELSDIFNMSAVAYFFAEDMMDKLGMPVGILNSSLGGSSIRSWLSREAIDGNEKIKNYLIGKGEYFSLSDWNEAEQSVYFDMTANFNQKIAPLKNFRISGMLWYQGETDLMTGNTEYAEMLNLLQSSYTDVFSYKSGLLPLVFTQIASYNYSEDESLLNNWNYEYTKMQQQKASSRALITIYDIPLTYLPDAGLIHPERKEEVGQRMADAAYGLVYNRNDSYTAATVSKVEITDNEIYVSFNNVGNGLTINGKTAKGFAICGKDGVYVNATAEIVSADTIKVYSDLIDNPKSVTYAYCVANQTANLYTTDNKELALPVAPFITDYNYAEKFWKEKTWTQCDDELTWHTEDDKFSGYYNTWNSNNAEISFSGNDSIDSTSGLNIASAKKSFYISPVTSYKENTTTKNFRDTETDYSSYGSISFYAKNNGTADVVFEGAKFIINPVMWYSPEITGTLDVSAIIPADGSWHYITLNLNKLYHLGNECSLSYDNEKLNKIRDIQFTFSSKDNSTASISIDNISFGPETEITGNPFDVNIENADSLIELLTAIILTIIGNLAKLF